MVIGFSLGAQIAIQMISLTSFSGSPNNR